MRLPPGTPVWLAGGVTEMRKGFDGLAMLVQESLPAHVKHKPAATGRLRSCLMPTSEVVPVI